MYVQFTNTEIFVVDYYYNNLWQQTNLAYYIFICRAMLTIHTFEHTQTIVPWVKKDFVPKP